MSNYGRRGMNTSILIIDDKPKLCKSLAQNFEHLGYRTTIATSRAEALAGFRASRMRGPGPGLSPRPAGF
jgi:CheY-like chemotaxis protein